MDTMETMSALRILAVLGAGQPTTAEIDLAERVGRLAAENGWVVLTGGGPGVMEAASRGAFEQGGLTVGILPTAGPSSGYPNPWVRIPIFTGMGMARNAINVLSANLCVAIGGGAGTLSEVAMALKAGIPVWCCGSWQLKPPGVKAPMPRVINDEREFLAALGDFLAR